MDFSKYTVPGSTVTAITVSMMISILLPIALMIIWRVKSKAKIATFFIGAATFVVFAMILESILHNVILSVMGQEAFTALPFYAIYGGLAAGIFEEIGRYISMRLFMKRSLDKKEAIMFGIGHGGTESILLLGMTMISNLIVAVMLNIGLGELMVTGLDSGMKQQVIDQLSPLWTMAPPQMLVGALERMFAITFHICASYLVYRSVKEHRFTLCLLAVILHALMDGITVVISKMTGSIFFAEIFIGVFAAVFAIVTVMIYRKEVSSPPCPSLPS